MKINSYLKVLAKQYLENKEKIISLKTTQDYMVSIKDTTSAKLINVQITLIKKQCDYIETAIITEYRELNPEGINVDDLYTKPEAFADWCSLMLLDVYEVLVCDEKGTLINTVSIDVVGETLNDTNHTKTFEFTTNKNFSCSTKDNIANTFYLINKKTDEGNDLVSIYSSNNVEVTNLFKEPLNVLSRCELISFLKFKDKDENTLDTKK